MDDRTQNKQRIIAVTLLDKLIRFVNDFPDFIQRGLIIPLSTARCIGR